MLSRCGNRNSKDYPRYGGRGVTITQAWLEYGAFHSWAMKSGYAPTLLIERIHNDGNYEPGNCGWTTASGQARNRRTNTNITAFGETKTAVEWSEDPRCMVSYPTLISRIVVQGLPPETAITHPPQPRIGGGKRNPILSQVAHT